YNTRSMGADAVDLIFLGTGTSAGIPMIGCHCEVCSSADPRDKRTRPSVVIRTHDQNVLVDATPELRLQCIANGIDMIEAVVFTHAHADHIFGLDDVRRFNALRGGPLDVWADGPTHRILSQCFAYAFQEPTPELKVFRPHLKRRDITGPFEVGGATWTPVKLFHAEMPVLGFRVGRLAYCTDVSRIPEESFALLEGLDVLVLDALQHKPHVSHFNLEQAIDAARRIRARQTLFTHIAHALGHEATNKTLPEGMRLAYDGERVAART
ncbi:MAG: MBL fold metallo-hydrolase, partial [Tepidisphaeraceae bacterium]